MYFFVILDNEYGQECSQCTKWCKSGTQRRSGGTFSLVIASEFKKTQITRLILPYEKKSPIKLYIIYFLITYVI